LEEEDQGKARQPAALPSWTMARPVRVVQAVKAGGIPGNLDGLVHDQYTFWANILLSHYVGGRPKDGMYLAYWMSTFGMPSGCCSKKEVTAVSAAISLSSIA
jgi:hypothetical protein